MDEKQYLQPTKGTVLKLSVVAELGEYSMDEVEFYCDFFTKYSRNVVHVTKAQMIREDENEYIANVDTNITGTGLLYMKFGAMLPDTDIEGDLRREVVTIPTDIKVV